MKNKTNQQTMKSGKSGKQKMEEKISRSVKSSKAAMSGKMMSDKQSDPLAGYMSPADRAMKNGYKVALEAHKEPANPLANDFEQKTPGGAPNQVKSAAEDATNINEALNNAGMYSNHSRPGKQNR